MNSLLKRTSYSIPGVIIPHFSNKRQCTSLTINSSCSSLNHELVEQDQDRDGMEGLITVRIEISFTFFQGKGSRTDTTLTNLGLLEFNEFFLM